MVKYREAVRMALCEGWDDIVTKDAVFGNGFKIAAYGMRLVLLYMFWYSVRIVVAVAAPLFAFLIMWSSRENKKYNREAERRANRDL